MFHKKIVAVGQIAALVALSACAEGPKLSETPAAQAPIPAGKSRIVVYRTNVMGFAVTPEVTVDSYPTGTCQANGVFFVDVKPGTHRLASSTETTASVQVQTQAAQKSYVECSIGMGLAVGRPNLTQVSADSAAGKIGGLTFTGQYSVPPS